MKLRALLLASFCVCVHFGAALGKNEGKQASWEKNLQVPENIEVSAYFDKPTYFLGENALVTLRVINKGSKPIEMSRSQNLTASRDDTFQVSATASDGTKVLDAHPRKCSVVMWNGPSWYDTVKPGQTWEHTVPFAHYRRIEHAGTYAVNVSTCFGWKQNGQYVQTSATTKVSFAEPKPFDAMKVVGQMCALNVDASGLSGQRTAAYRDFRTLSYPVYLPIVEPMARAGSADGMTALGEIATPEATRVLIDLAKSMDRKLALAAAQNLDFRLPDPSFASDRCRGTIFEDLHDAERERMCSLSWRNEFGPEVRQIALNYTARKDVEFNEVGGYMLECVGVADDLKIIYTLGDRAWSQVVTRKETNPPPFLSAEECKKENVANEYVENAFNLAVRTNKMPLTPVGATQRKMLERLQRVREYEAFKKKGN